MWVRSQEAGMRENKHKNGSSVNCAEWPVKIVDFKMSVSYSNIEANMSVSI